VFPAICCINPLKPTKQSATPIANGWTLLTPLSIPHGRFDFRGFMVLLSRPRNRSGDLDLGFFLRGGGGVDDDDDDDDLSSFCGLLFERLLDELSEDTELVLGVLCLNCFRPWPLLLLPNQKI
jgi:hypothetical protein